MVYEIMYVISSRENLIEIYQCSRNFETVCLSYLIYDLFENLIIY